jgi:hypothetical protein
MPRSPPPTAGCARRSPCRYGERMSFQAYLDAVERKTGLTPRQLLELATERGLAEPGVKAGAIVQWLADDYGLGRGHAMAMVHVIQKGPQISTKHVGTDGVHRDESATLWLDGVASKPQA